MTGTVYVDADACPVKPEIYRVAGRHRWPVVLVANSGMLVPRDEDVRLVVVPDGPDEADKWIAAHAGPGDVVVTADVPLADRCVKAGAAVIAPSGRPFTPDAIGMALAMRDLMTDLRSAGAVTSGPAPFGPKDRSRFLSALHDAIVRIGRPVPPAVLTPAPVPTPARNDERPGVAPGPSASSDPTDQNL